MSEQASDKSVQDNFNAAAHKIVSLDEVDRRVKVMQKAELTARERMLHYFVDLPVTAAAVVADMVKGWFNPSHDEKLRQLTGDVSTGYYKDTRTGELFVNTAITETEMKKDWSHHVTPKLTAKVNAMERKALQEAADYSHLRREGRLKPL